MQTCGDCKREIPDDQGYQHDGDKYICLTCWYPKTGFKVPVQSVTIQRAEGMVGLDDFDLRTFPSFSLANIRLMEWAATAPREGGYDKVDFTVQWLDGETYKGRFDLEGQHVHTADIGVHIWNVASVTSGRLKPGWATEEDWERMKRVGERRGIDRAAWGRLLDTYALQDGYHPWSQQ